LRRSMFSEHGGDPCSTECGTRSRQVPSLRKKREGWGTRPARCRCCTVTQWHNLGPRG
jgi:hypothetical protein